MYFIDLCMLVCLGVLNKPMLCQSYLKAVVSVCGKICQLSRISMDLFCSEHSPF